MTWVSLQTHSCYSILNGITSVENLVDTALQRKMHALALTDLGTMHGLVDFYTYAKSKGIKPILGFDAYIIIKRLNDDKCGRRDAQVRVTLLAKNNFGYKKLCKLSSKGFNSGNFLYVPRVFFEEIAECAGDIVVLSGALSGPIGHAFLYKTKELALEILVTFALTFKDDFYSAIARAFFLKENIEEDGVDIAKEIAVEIYNKEQARFNAWVIQVSKEHNIKIVATNDVFYADKEDWILRDILLNISTGSQFMLSDNAGNYVPNPKRRIAPTIGSYLQGEEFERLFDDIPEAIESTLEIAEKCSASIDTSSQFYPVYQDVEPSWKTEEERIDLVEKKLRDICRNNLVKKYCVRTRKALKRVFPEANIDAKIAERIEFEFKILSSCQLCDYIMIVQDFIAWAKKNGIFVGPGRGSGVGSIILFLLDITDIEPMHLGLFFERFINPERPSYPDIDVDVCMARRSEVIGYITNKYGRENVAHIVTYGTMKTRMAIRDVGRALAINLNDVNRIVSLIPDHLGITIDESLKSNKELMNEYKASNIVRTLIDYSKKLEGCVRNVGTHAAGILVSGEKLEKNIPVFRSSKCSDLLISQYSMKPVEKVGMLKIDILGLRTLTIINHALNRIYEEDNEHLNINDLDVEDKVTYEYLQLGKTTGIFQLESPGMQELLRKVRPSKFSDIVAIISLYRPGPMEMIPEFIERKNGVCPIDYIHPDLKSILEDTYGIIVYQEQVMHIANVIAGYSRGEGDILRRAMGKKDAVAMKEQRTIFCERAEKAGYSKSMVGEIFSKMEKFAAYGFNKSHAAAYAKISFIASYIKVRYPGIWLEVLLTDCFSDKGRIREILSDVRAHGYSLKCPNINSSRAARFHYENKTIIYPLSGIKGMRESACAFILDIRSQGGRFLSFESFIQRINPSLVGKKVISLLISSGAFDEFGTRNSMDVWHEKNFDLIRSRKVSEDQGVLFLYKCEPEGKILEKEDKPKISFDTLMQEKELLGSFITASPSEKWFKCLREFGIDVVRLDTFYTCIKNGMTIVFMEKIKVLKDDGVSMGGAKCTVSDRNVSYIVFIGSKVYTKYHNRIKEFAFYIMNLQSVKKRDGTIKVICKYVSLVPRSASYPFFEQAIKESRDDAYRAKSYQKNSAFTGESIEEISFDLNIMTMKSVLKIKDILGDSVGGDKVRFVFKSLEGVNEFEFTRHVTYSNFLKLKKLSGLIFKA